MRRMFAAALLAFAMLTGAAHAQSRSDAAAGQFDYYVLALSWSPTYCADAENATRDALQCRSSRPFAFVVHGLWPQFERGFPSQCRTRFGGVDAAVENQMLDIMPSRALIRHEWREHGVCSGLDPQRYFAQTRTLFGAITLPPAYRTLNAPLRVTASQVEQAFLAANPGFSRDGLAIVCRGGRLREVRACFTKDGRARACGPDVRDSCQGTVTMPPVRAGR